MISYVQVCSVAVAQLQLFGVQVPAGCCSQYEPVFNSNKYIYIHVCIGTLFCSPVAPV